VCVIDYSGMGCVQGHVTSNIGPKSDSICERVQDKYVVTMANS